MQAGDFHVGIRSDDAPLLADLRQRYKEHLVEDDRAVDDFGLVAARADGTGVRALPHLVHGRCPLLRSRSVARLLRRLDVELGCLVADPTPRSVALYGLGAIVKDGRAALVPTAVTERSTAVERAVARSGAGVAESEGLRLDPVAGELIVPAGLIGHAAVMGDGGDGLGVPPGRYEVAGVFWSGRQHDDHERPATALVRLLAHVGDPRDLSRSEMLHALAAMRTTFSLHPLADTGVADLPPVLDCLS